MGCSLISHRFRRQSHQVIAEILERFDPVFLGREGIAFGGGTRIALELDEYRESVDIDLICPTTSSYRAVRQTVHGNGLGVLLRAPLDLARDVRASRDKVVTAIVHAGKVVKLEILSFPDWNLGCVDHPWFPVPILDHTACFATKLTAANDRGFAFPYKDVVDLLMMRAAWGEVHAAAIAEAERHYGPNVLSKAEAAIAHFLQLPEAAQWQAAQALGMQEDCMANLLHQPAPKCHGGMTP